MNKVKTLIRRIANCVNLDTLHVKGDGRPQDFRKALECYLKIVQKGHTQALISVGDLFLEGEAVHQNSSIAMDWYLKAAYLGDNNARFKIDRLRLELPRLSTPLRVPLLNGLENVQQDGHRDNARAEDSPPDSSAITVEEPVSVPPRNGYSVPIQEVLPTSNSFTLNFANMIAKAEAGDHFAQETLGDICMDGRVTSNDFQAAIDWYLKARNHGSMTALGRLRPICYTNGPTQEFLTALDRHRKAAEQGNFIAQCNVGGLYMAAKEYTKAMTWFEKTAKQGDARSQSNIGHLYRHGLGVDQDYATAMIWYQKAAEQGDAKSQHCMGQMFEDGGFGVAKDKSKALLWYKKAADQDYLNAKDTVKKLERQGYNIHGRKKPSLFDKIFN
ncbi:hypothetical protein EC991_009998 [Linnemannia zychae]|nr:hypothetical protein EC991_009998 [Linnemannia zychae]